MKQTAVVVAPGRGTYNRGELGYFAQHHMDKAGRLAEFDGYRAARGQKTLSELDGAARENLIRRLDGAGFEMPGLRD